MNGQIINNFIKINKNRKFILLLIVSFFFLLITINILNKYNKYSSNLIVKNDLNNRKNFIVPDMKRPFLNIYDNNDNKINVVFITHPFTRDECFKKYNEAKKKRSFIYWNVKLYGVSRTYFKSI